MNQNNFAYYKRLFKNLTNPNGCQVHGTFFLLHDYNNYHNIMELKHAGHEMAVSSISDDKSLYLKNYTAWTDELAGMRRIMALQAEVSEEEVLGVRAPGAKPGYNTQYEVMIDYGFIWDSSISVPPQVIISAYSRPSPDTVLDYSSLALHSGLCCASQVQGKVVSNKTIPGNVGDSSQLSLCRGIPRRTLSFP